LVNDEDNVSVWFGIWDDHCSTYDLEGMFFHICHGNTHRYDFSVVEKYLEALTNAANIHTTVLSQAFADQTLIGWDRLLRGRISIKWHEAFQILTNTGHNSSTSPMG
jgi:hypothetical protein